MKKTWLNPRLWSAKLLLPLFVIIFLALGFLNYLQPVKSFLDSNALSFNIGTTRFSAYLLLKAALTILILFWITNIFLSLCENRIQNIKHINTSNKALIIKIFQIFVYFLAFIIGLNILGIDLTALAIFSGAIGIGVGFGLQKIASNFISGLILLFEKSIKYNDMIQLSDGTCGLVRHTGARYTLVEAPDGKEIMIPNEDFMTSRVINWTYSNKRARVDIAISVSYNSDIEKARELMIEAAKEHPRCMKDPIPACFLREFGDSAINFLLFFWLEDVTEGKYEPQSDVMRSILKKFKAHNITIPFPQQDIYIKNFKIEE